MTTELPGFVTIDPVHDQGGAMNYGSAFLPAAYQGTRLSAGGSGVIFGRNVWQREWGAALGIIDQIKETLLKSHVRIP